MAIGHARCATTATSRRATSADDATPAKTELQARRRSSRHARGIGFVRPARTTTSRGEPNASVATLARMGLKEHRLAADAADSVEVAAELAEAVAVVSDAVEVADEVLVVDAAEGDAVDVEIVEDLTNHSAGSKAKARRRTTKRLSLMTKF